MSKFTIKKSIVFLLCVAIFLLIFLNIPYNLLNTITDKNIITYEELNNIKSNSPFVTTHIECLNADSIDEDIKEYTVKYKLFNLFNITNLKVNVVADDEVYAGGNCLGFSLQSKGAVIVGSNYVITSDGIKNPFATSGLQVGDVIIKIDDNPINVVSDITKSLDVCEGRVVNLTVKRGDKTLNLNITPSLDMQTNKYKLGLWLKDDASGVGTLTFVNNTTKRFGSLGHAITNSSGQIFEVSGGEIYNANVIGVKKGERGVPGELLGIFNQSNSQGLIDKNNNYGVYGTINEDNDLILNKQAIELGGRLTAKPGKAHILTTIDGQNIEMFDIEIIKTNFQNSAEEKSMVIRVTDSKLLNKTGGIVQGMSGSPIIQDGKLVGAVTHVFVNDPTKGFGLYLDWMINE